jgi:hypothetical protein
MGSLLVPANAKMLCDILIDTGVARKVSKDAIVAARADIYAAKLHEAWLDIRHPGKTVSGEPFPLNQTDDTKECVLAFRVLEADSEVVYKYKGILSYRGRGNIRVTLFRALQNDIPMYLDLVTIS